MASIQTYDSFLNVFFLNETQRFFNEEEEEDEKEKEII